MIEENIVSKRMEQIDKFMDVDLDVDDENLSDQITCGDKWDDPVTLGKAMDKQPQLYAQWAYFFKHLKNERIKVKSLLDTWIAQKKEEIRDQIYDENIKKGITPNNSIPTGSAVDNRFKTSYEEVNGDGEYIDEEYEHFDNIVSDIESKISGVEIVVKAFDQRHSMLISMSSLVRSMMDNQLIVKKAEKFNEE